MELCTTQEDGTPLPEETLPRPQVDEQEETILPDYIKTPTGTGITFYSRRKCFPIKVRYGTYHSSCLVEVSSPEPGPILEKYINQGYVEERDGSLNQELHIPMELFTLPSGEHCAVLITDLCSQTRGFCNLQTQPDTTSKNLFRTLYKLANAVICMLDNGLYLSKWTGQEFYCDSQYEHLTVVLNSDTLSDDASLNDTHRTEKALTAALLYYLTGAFPVLEDGTPYADLIEAQGDTLCFNGTTQSVTAGADNTTAFWDTLPQRLKTAFTSCFFTPVPMTAQEWAALLSDLADTEENTRCVHCGKQVLSGASVCPHCKGNLDKRQLMGRWLVTDSAHSKSFGIVLPINVVLDCCMLSAALPKGPVMQMGYSAKRNLLALQNICNETLAVDYGNQGTYDAAPRNVFSLKIGMKITVPQTQGITLTLLGFDPCTSWKVDDNV